MIQTKSLSYEAIKQSGEMSKSQVMYLSVFADSVEPFTHREATYHVLSIFGKGMPARNSRISELEQMGFLKKYDTVKDDVTGHEVNRWIWTGRKNALICKETFVQCSHCEGKGGRVQRVYIPEGVEPQKDFFA